MTTRKRFSLNEYYSDFNLKWLVYFGMWNRHDDDSRKWLYYCCYSSVSIFVIFVVRTMGCVHRVWLTKEDFMACTMSSSFAAGYLCTIMKNINLIMRRSDIVFILETFNWERNISCTREIATHRNRCVTGAIKTTKKFTFIWAIIVTLYNVFFFYSSLVENGWSIDALPISDTPLKRIARGHNFWIVLTLDFITWSAFTYTILAHDSLFLSLMIQTSAQLNILNHRLKNCANDRAVRYGEDTPDADVIQFDCCEINIKTESLDPNEELIKCIQHYQQIFQIVKTLQSVFGSILLPQLISSLTMMSLIGFHVFVAKTIDLSKPPKAIFITVFFESLLCQLFAFCWSGDCIIEESDKTSTSLYQSCWYRGNRSFRTNVKVFSSLVENPMVVSAVGLFDLSVITYKNIIIKSYSAMTVLKKAYK
ncbi:uncharacterized protein LOC135166875 isoform X2 [Diachasmimorpha longicaudata]|uniref:uncharacterized protein LOC135166875 isoform X2 n=1 Tax=Diachasmimorpha longicaudata TaxID=58733 RepID=UPI0030B8957C